MQELRSIVTTEALPVGWGLRILLLSPDPASRVADDLSGLGSLVEVETDLYAALDALCHDPTGFGLFVMDCDPFGGFDAGRRAMLMLVQRPRPIPTILLSRNCPEQMFPEARHAPILLRAPLSKVALRVGFEHATRDRLVFRAG